MRHVLIAAGLLLAALGSPASAQTSVTAAQAADLIARGLVAQYEAALIRERRLADDRELQLISQYETRIRTLRMQVENGASDVLADLVQARADYAASVSSIVARDSEAQALTEAYATQVMRDIAEASPEQRAALQRFADGDLEEGFNQYQAESVRRREARERVLNAAAQAARATNAADARQLASMGETLRLNGSKTVAEVIALYESATQLDPSVASPWLSLARLYPEAGRREGSRRAAEQGLAANPSSYERSELQIELGVALMNLGRLAEARATFEDACQLARTLLAADPANVQARHRLAVALSRLTPTLADQGYTSRAREAAEESISILRRLIANDQSNINLQRDLSIVLDMMVGIYTAQGEHEASTQALDEVTEIYRRIADDVGDADKRRDQSNSLVSEAELLRRRGDYVGAQRGYRAALDALEEQAATDPNNLRTLWAIGNVLKALGHTALAQNDLDTARQRYEFELEVRRRLVAMDPSGNFEEDVRSCLMALGGVLVGLGDIDGAEARYGESLALSRRILASDPTNAITERNMTVLLNRLGELKIARGDLEGARGSYEEALAVRRRLGALDTSNAQSRRDIWMSLQRLARNFPDGDVTWADLADYLEDLDRRNLLSEGDRPVLDEAQANAAREQEGSPTPTGSALPPRR